jgi:acyl transferase domain-containing protein
MPTENPIGNDFCFQQHFKIAMSESNYDPVAIVGLACRFPGAATDPDKFWELIVNGVNTWSDVPLDRFNWKAFQNSNSNHSGSIKHRGGHFLDEDIALFDAEFFGISPLEARCIDPQQRLLLETTYEALESAGIQLEHARSSEIGVFCSMFSQDYDLPKYQSTGTESTFLANRISYAFDLRGPSMTVNTACSGGLVALHLACQSLASRECPAAIVGGANLILSPDAMVGMSNLKLVLPRPASLISA